MHRRLPTSDVICNHRNFINNNNGKNFINNDDGDDFLLLVIYNRWNFIDNNNNNVKHLLVSFAGQGEDVHMVIAFVDFVIYIIYSHYKAI